MSAIHPTDLIQKLNPLQVQKYLKSRDWQAVVGKRQHIAILVSSDGHYEVTLPLERKFSDYRQAMIRAVERIAEAENCPIDEVLRTLLHPVADVLKFRLADEATELGSIPIEVGSQLLLQAKAAIYSAACDVIQPELYHPRLAFHNADRLVNTCRLGQTEHGSFVINIICPFTTIAKDDRLQQASLFDNTADLANSFTRQVTEKLMTSLGTLKSVIERDAWAEVENDSQPAFSGNFVTALTDLKLPTENSLIEIQASWAPTVPQQHGDMPSTVSFSRDYLTPAASWVSRIKEKKGHIGTFIGRISSLKTQDDPQKRKSVSFTLVFFNDNNKPQQATVSLPADALGSIASALTEGKHVRVSGILVGSKKKQIEQPEVEILT